jgi:hypothetical protein
VPVAVVRESDAGPSGSPRDLAWVDTGRCEERHNTEYGLTGGVISRDLNAASDVVSRVRSGIIHINDQGVGDEPMAPSAA